MIIRYLAKLVAIGVMLLFFVGCSSTKNITSSKNTKAQDQAEMEFLHYFIEGNKMKTLGYFPEAVAAYNKCLDLNGNSAAANYELANINIFANNYAKALEYSQKAVDINSDNMWYQMLLGSLMIQNNQYDEALDILEKLNTKYPQNLDLLLSLAELYSKNDKYYKKALSLYNRAEQQVGMTEELFFLKEQMYIKLGKEKELLADMKKLVDEYPDNPRYIGLYAETCMNYGQEQEAKNAYKRLFEVDPNNPIGHLSYGEFLMKKNEKSEAWLEFEIGLRDKDLALKPKIDLVVSLMAYYRDNVYGDEIHKLLDIINEIHTDRIEGHALKAELYLKDENLKSAQIEIIKVTEIEKDNYLLWEQLIAIDADLNEYRKMYDHSKQAIELFPNYPKFILYHGWACQHTKMYQEGIDILDIGLDLVFDQNDLQAQFYSALGELYYRKNDYSKSDESFDKALKINSNDKFILNNYSYYLSLRGDKLEKAKQMAKKVVDLETKNSTYLDTYAWVLYKSKDYDAALKNIEEALKYSTDPSAVLIEHYGDILYRLGQVEKAIEEWKRARRKGTGSEFLDQKIEREELIE